MRRTPLGFLGSLALGLLLAPAAWAADATAPVTLDKPLLGYWNFDQPPTITCPDASGQGCPAVAASGTALQATAGLFGGAWEFSGNHQVALTKAPALADLKAMSFSVWVAPTNLGEFREIFRKEDGQHRVLFSFQEHGQILSLGLDIGGYVECDARIDPKQLLDGAWHHCAATFDGQWMRVYLDGREVGQLERPGTITSQGDAPACLASSNGGECFQGAMDELRLYGAALSTEELAQLYRNGSQAAIAQTDALWPAPGSFAETLVGLRRTLAEKQLTPDRRLAGTLMIRLRSAFPQECEAFRNYTNLNAIDYITSPEDSLGRTQAQRLLTLLLEYRPLTPEQWKRQTPEQLEEWKQAEPIEKRYQALETAEADLSPAWIDFILETGPLVDFRPVKNEPVAPYQEPQTPETRTLSAAEAQEALQRDWLFQADDQPTPARIQDEIRWTRDLAARLTAEYPGEVDFTAALNQLDQLEQQAARRTEADAALYFQVRVLKRSIALANPVLDFQKILMVDMPYPQGGEWRHETRHRLGYMAVPGARLLVLDGLKPDGKLRQLMPQAPLHGAFWRPDLSFDAQKVLFSYKPHNEKAFHLYEINVDGTNLVQLTDGIYDDLDPIYLPDGQHFMFITTRGHNYVRCMPPTNSFLLARCDADGKNIYLISQTNEPEYLPSAMPDGRVIYTRWEYTDKPLWRAQKLWTVNPDGTQAIMFWGNQSVWPDLLKDARAIPGSRRVMFTGSAHHDWFAGSVGIVDPDKGRNFPHGLTKVTADVVWPETGNGPVDPVESPRYHRSGNYNAYHSPHPLSEKDFLVSACRQGKFCLYLMDVDGNRELIYEGVHNIFHAQPLKPRTKPPLVADRVDWPTPDKRNNPNEGVVYSSNIYQGAPEEVRGKARYLRILSVEPKTYTYWYKRPYISTGPSVSAVQSDGVKRILGTVPIESDGSVAFNAPAGKALHFQLLDENHLALQTMRSFTGVMPGERRGCQGCHELHSTAPTAATKPLALTKPTQTITPPPWGEDTVSYARYVQPVLNQYCGNCHQGEGEARKTLDLTLRPSYLGSAEFCEPYLTLIGRPTWASPYERPQTPPPGFGIANVLMVEAYSTVDPKAYVTPKPMTHLSYGSRLVELASSGKHYGVKVDEVSRQRLIAWIDAMCPYLGDDEVRAIDDPIFQGVDWLAIRPQIRNAPVIPRPGPVD